MPKYPLEGDTRLRCAGPKAAGGSALVAAIKELTEAAGGKLESMYFAFGDRDVYCIVDLPDNVTPLASRSLWVPRAGPRSARWSCWQPSS